MTRDEQEIRDLVSTWMSATKAGDTDAVLSLMTDDVVFLAPTLAPSSICCCLGRAASGSRSSEPMPPP